MAHANTEDVYSAVERDGDSKNPAMGSEVVIELCDEQRGACDGVMVGAEWGVWEQVQVSMIDELCVGH